MLNNITTVMSCLKDVLYGIKNRFDFEDIENEILR